MPFTNILVYRQMVIENYDDIVALNKLNRTPKENGNGYIYKYDPTIATFKKSLIVITFAGMWLEATFHQFMVTNHSKNQFKNHNKARYKEKLKLMGISDPSILEMTEAFQNTRNEIIHEKVFMDKGETKIAEDEAEHAHKIIEHVSKLVII